MSDITNVTNRGQITNPYDKEHRAEYKMGLVEGFLHDKLGFRTGYDTYNENMDNASAAWLAQQENNVYEEQYNSAEAQAQRMRDAGLNPDIAPNTVAPGEATEFTEPESMPESPAGIDIDAFSKATEISAKIAAVALDAITGSAGIFSTITNAGIGLAKGGLELDTKEAELGQTLRKMADESYGEIEPIITGLGNLAGGTEWAAKKLAPAGDFMAKARGLSGKNKKKFAAMYNALVNGATAKMKTLEKQSTITELEANPRIAAPYMYKQIEMTKAKHDAQVYNILLWKAEEEGKVLQEFPELFRGMTAAQMRQKISEAVTSGNQAEISKYEKAIKRLDSIDRKSEQDQRDADRNYIKNFEWSNTYNSMNNIRNYYNASERIYGRTPSGGIRAATGF